MKKLLNSLTLLKNSIDRILSFIIHPSLYDSHEENNISRGELWSLLKMENTTVGLWWKDIYPIAQKLFPELRFVEPEELHLTIVIVGPWNEKNLPKIKKLSSCIPHETIDSNLSLHFMGPYKQWLALELENVPDKWKKSIIKKKSEILHEGLMKPTPYDHDFKAHISLATPRSTPIPPRVATHPLTQEERKAMKRLKKFLDGYTENLKLTLTPSEAKECASFWLSSATRPADYHTYIPLEDWITFYMSNDEPDSIERSCAH